MPSRPLESFDGAAGVSVRGPTLWMWVSISCGTVGEPISRGPGGRGERTEFHHCDVNARAWTVVCFLHRRPDGCCGNGNVTNCAPERAATVTRKAGIANSATLASIAIVGCVLRNGTRPSCLQTVPRLLAHRADLEQRVDEMWSVVLPGGDAGSTASAPLERRAAVSRYLVPSSVSTVGLVGSAELTLTLAQAR